MRRGRLAYKLKFGKPALIEDIVEIFDFGEDLKFVEIKEQLVTILSCLKV
ncbi:hypothetical protein [Lysinibacillus sp. Ag94]|nr:hypothetical protein [Lysinibacillus sp. Ag94]UPW81660.1 hypothetical protein MY533_12945 [Lysinibacillus sp. Ag94]